ncbi:hypothetical protein DV735_g815, partial [Chaetothyriales sp. CBS 134920]
MAPSAFPFFDPFESQRKSSSPSSGSVHSLHKTDAQDGIAEPGIGPRDGVDSGTTSACSSVSVDVTAFQGHRDTLARIPKLHRRANELPAPVTTRLLRYLSRQDCLNLRLVCRHWNAFLPKPCLRSLYRLPAEILQLIFAFLGPADFDAARHACRQWFAAAMNTSLLRSLLRTAQCCQAHQADIALSSLSLQSNGDGPTTEWLMAKRLATTARLSVDWRGSAGADSFDDNDASILGGRLHLVQEIDFQSLVSERQAQNKTFTVSTCGKYLLVISGRVVFVYRLAGSTNSAETAVKLAADRDVLQVSMDTSSGRYAVAALLENRVGILWDLIDEGAGQFGYRHSGEPMTLGMRTVVHGPAAFAPVSTTSSPLPLRGQIIEDNGDLVSSSSSLDQHGLSFSASESGRGESSSFRASSDWCESPEADVESSIPPASPARVRIRVTAMYRNLGNPDDLPRSIAICPHRKCVAFGCRIGIELHWVDALTGGDLSRYDGFHLLYTDPTTRLLYIGSDAPLGGPTNLIRKVAFVPPATHSDEEGQYMFCYAAGHALNWGVTIVAAHLDGRLVLYHLPSDLFERVRKEPSSSEVWDQHAGVLAQSDLIMDEMLSQRQPTTYRDLNPDNETAQAWYSTPDGTLHVEGIEFGRVDDVVDDIAVNTAGGGLSVWVFGRRGIARQYSIFRKNATIRKRHAGENGLLSEKPSGKGKGKA